MFRGSDPFEPQASTDGQATTARYWQVVDPQRRDVMASLEEESHPAKIGRNVTSSGRGWVGVLKLPLHEESAQR